MNILRPMLFLSLAAVILFPPARAKESASCYWGGGIGYVYMPDAAWKDPYAAGDVSFDGGPGLSLALGISPGYVPLRLELQWLYQAVGISGISSDRLAWSMDDIFMSKMAMPSGIQCGNRCGLSLMNMNVVMDWAVRLSRG